MAALPKPKQAEWATEIWRSEVEPYSKGRNASQKHTTGKARKRQMEHQAKDFAAGTAAARGQSKAPAGASPPLNEAGVVQNLQQHLRAQVHPEAAPQNQPAATQNRPTAPQNRPAAPQNQPATAPQKQGTLFSRMMDQAKRLPVRKY